MSRSHAAVHRVLAVMALALVLVLAAPGASFATHSGQNATKAGLTVYIGLMPAEIVRGHPPSHAEAQAHGGAPRGAHQYHVVVAVFDAGTGARIENAKVVARVSALGLAGSQKTLEPMKIADTITYGNYFDLPGSGKYQIVVEIERPQGAAKFEFPYDH